MNDQEPYFGVMVINYIKQWVINGFEKGSISQCWFQFTKKTVCSVNDLGFNIRRKTLKNSMTGFHESELVENIFSNRN